MSSAVSLIALASVSYTEPPPRTHAKVKPEGLEFVFAATEYRALLAMNVCLGM